MSYKTALLTATASLAATLIPSAAMALSFNWSFVTNVLSTGGAGQTISGTISGLVEGSNDGTGLTVEVTSTPTGELTGGGWTFDSTANGGDAFTVTGGNVTFADAFFTRSDAWLFFGGFGGYVPELTDSITFDPDWFTTLENTFTPLSTSATPEPASVLALLSLGLATYGWRSRKQG